MLGSLARQVPHLQLVTQLHYPWWINHSQPLSNIIEFITIIINHQSHGFCSILSSETTLAWWDNRSLATGNLWRRISVYHLWFVDAWLLMVIILILYVVFLLILVGYESYNLSICKLPEPSLSIPSIILDSMNLAIAINYYTSLTLSAIIDINHS